jgi:hypothetical protein
LCCRALQDYNLIIRRDMHPKTCLYRRTETLPRGRVADFALEPSTLPFELNAPVVEIG